MKAIALVYLCLSCSFGLLYGDDSAKLASSKKEVKKKATRTAILDYFNHFKEPSIEKDRSHLMKKSKFLKGRKRKFIIKTPVTVAGARGKAGAVKPAPVKKDNKVKTFFKESKLFSMFRKEKTNEKNVPAPKKEATKKNAATEKKVKTIEKKKTKDKEKADDPKKN